MINRPEAPVAVNSPTPLPDSAAALPAPAAAEAVAVEPVLCEHCGRTASNGLVCIGMCVADSGY
jgi:hypothetical protein